MTKRAVMTLFISVLMWILAFVLDIEVFYAVSSIAMAIMVVSLGALFIQGKDFEITRKVPLQVRQGEIFNVEISVHLRKSKSHGPFFLQDNNTSSPPSKNPVIWVSGIAPEHTVKINLEMKARIRGEHKLQRITIITYDALGLFRRTLKIKCHSYLLVMPQWEHLESLPFCGRKQSFLVGMDHVPVEGFGSEFFGVREYRKGDGMRRIHWKSTARTQTPMVRQYESESHPNIAVFVDTDVKGLHRYDAEDMLDKGTGVALSIAKKTLSSSLNFRCFAMTCTGDIASCGGSGENREQSIIRFLAEISQCHIPTVEALRKTTSMLYGSETFIAILEYLNGDIASALMSCAQGARPVIVFLLEMEFEEKHQSRWFNISKAEPDFEMEKCITGLRAYGIQVIRVPEFSDLETVLNAWSSHLKIAGATL